jgi:hypothetical protein
MTLPCAPYAPVAAWFPVPRYSEIQRQACRGCGGLTVMRLVPTGMFVRAAICCRCGTFALALDPA